ncbi:hypothetical protein Tco_0731985 [Tanacetum coccineum]
MRTRSQSRNQNRPQQQAPPVVVEPFNLEEPFDMAANGAGGAGPPPVGGGGLPVPDLRTMEELCQPSLDGRGGPIAPIAIHKLRLLTLRMDMISTSSKFLTAGPLMKKAPRKSVMIHRGILDRTPYNDWILPLNGMSHRVLSLLLTR